MDIGLYLAPTYSLDNIRGEINMGKIFKYPTKLVEYLEEHSAEGNEIVTTYTEYSIIWLVTYPSREKEVTIVEYIDGTDNFSLVHLNDMAFDRVMKVMKEVE